MRELTYSDPNTGNEVTFDWEDDNNEPDEATLDEIFKEARTFKQEAPAREPDTEYTGGTFLKKLQRAHDATLGKVDHAVSGLHKGVQDAVIGVTQKGIDLANYFGIVDPKVARRFHDLVGVSEDLYSTATGDDPVSTGARVASKMGIASRLPMGKTGGGLLLNTARGARAGGAVSAMDYIPEDESSVEHVGKGLAYGAGGAFIPHLIGKAWNSLHGDFIDPAMQNIKDIAKQFNLRVTAGELANNPHLKRVETMLEKVPIFGLRKFRERQHEGANNAVMDLLHKYMVNPKAENIAIANRVYVGKQYQNMRTLVSNVKEKIVPYNTKRVAKELNETYDMFQVVQNRKATRIIKGVLGDLDDVDSIIISPVTKKPIKKFKTLSFDDAWILRRGLGEAIGQARRKLSSSSGDVSHEQLALLSKMFKAVDDDINLWTQKIKKPEIRKAFTGANDAYKKYVVKWDVLRRAYDKGSFNRGMQQLVSPQKFSKELGKIIEQDGVKSIFQQDEIKKMTGMMNIMQVIHRAGQYMEDVPTADRWMGWGAMGGTALVGGVKGVIAGASMSTLFKYLTTTDMGQKMMLTASQIRPESPAMQGLMRTLYKQLPVQSSVLGAQSDPLNTRQGIVEPTKNYLMKGLTK